MTVEGSLGIILHRCTWSAPRFPAETEQVSSSCLFLLGRPAGGGGGGGAMTELGLGGAGPSDMCLTNPQRERRWAVRGGWLAGGRNGKQA